MGADRNGRRISSGIGRFDSLLLGGFAEGTFNCIQGEIGTGTSTFCIQTVWSRLVSGGLASYICLDEMPEKVIEHFSSFGYNIEPYIKQNRILFTDAHPLIASLSSSSHTQNGVAERKIALARFLHDYMEMTCTLRKANSHIRLPVVTVLDSFSALAPFIDLKSAYVLVHMVADSARKHGNIILAVAHTGAIEANIVCACNAAADGIIKLENHLSRGLRKRVMRIDKMAFTPTPSYSLEFRISSNSGIEILSTNDSALLGSKAAH